MILRVIAIFAISVSFKQICCLISEIRNKKNPPLYTTLPYYEPKTCGELGFPEEVDQDQAHLSDHPWVVGIVFWFPAYKNHIVDCSGVLIAERYALTAGVCVTADDVSTPKYVRIGEWNTSSRRDCENFVCIDHNYQDIPMEKVFTRYDSNWEFNDNIAVIKLWNYVKPSRYVQHICLPNVEMHENIKSYVGSSFVVSGWGTLDKKISEIKLKLLVVVDPDEVCQNYPFYRLKYEPSTHFCSNSTRACSGVGPVMGIDASDPDNPFWYIFGFFLYTPECSNAPRMFTKVIPYMKWIQEQMLLSN